MIKRDEIEDPESCFNKARDDERLFVLIARDPAAPVAIRAWIAERIRLGKNVEADAQVREAIDCALRMEAERLEIESTRRQESMCWGSAGTFAISRLHATYDTRPIREEVNWREFLALFEEPRRTPCHHATCAIGTCPHRRGACWSPAAYADGGRVKVEAVSLLVIDVDRVVDDQLDDLRGRLGGFRYLIHATHSDRPECRSVRVVVALSRPVSSSEWLSFRRGVGQVVGIAGDPASADVGRVYYMPSCSEDAGYFVQVNDGAPLDVDAILATTLAKVSAPDGLAEEIAAHG